LGYDHIIIHGQRMHHGVAIVVLLAVGHVAARRDIDILQSYAVWQADADMPRLGIGRMIDWSGQLDCPTILTGDFNIAPLESDVWSHKPPPAGI
jgi:exodeoxyribonuclease-3